MSHKQNTYIILYEGILIDWYNNRNISVWKYFSNLLWLTSWNKKYLNLIILLLKKILNPFLMESINYSCTLFFKLQIKLLIIWIIISMTRNMNNLWFFQHNLSKWFKIQWFFHNIKFFIVFFDNLFKTWIFQVKI